ncbi:MAG: cupredoxin domain-containing protein [Gammaproteobacteria bacterium]|nr:cupredoxin domain-containing protein [Gammaproteobacteria bacterium]
MKRTSRPLHTLSALAALLIAVLCAAALVSNSRPAAAAPARSAKPSAITINNYTFHPGVLTVAKGSTVVWINKDDDVHTIKGTDGPEAFNSPALETGSKFGFTFDHPGTYHYICTVHPYMHGVIVVR